MKLIPKIIQPEPYEQPAETLQQRITELEGKIAELEAKINGKVEINESAATK